MDSSPNKIKQNDYLRLIIIIFLKLSPEGCSLIGYTRTL